MGKILSGDIVNYFSRLFPRVEYQPIIFIGNQKSGTTAIPALLSEATGVAAQLDIPPLWEPVLSEIYRGRLTLRDFVNENKSFFVRKILKEPCLTFLYPSLNQIFPDARIYIIIRDPFENIRSILNRLRIPGDLIHLDLKDYQVNSATWDRVLDNGWLGIQTDHYIDSLSERWNFCASLYLNNKDRVRLIRYEDFIQDKVRFVITLAEELALPYIHDISDRVDHSFQRSGDRSLSGEDFFGKLNFNRIALRCQHFMNLLGYTVD